MKSPDHILIDGSSYMFRAFYVPQLKRMTTSEGQPTGAVFGLLNMIKSLRTEYPEANLIAVFDAKGKTFRNDLYPEYKANRPPMPDELRSQIEFIHAGVRALGLPLIAMPDVEADDVIGTYAVQAANAGQTVLIASGDKDLAQVVNANVNIIDTMKKVIYDEAGVVDKFGVRPDQMIDYLTLVGDSSDNVPGVPKVGPKTAVKWLQEYDSLECLVEKAEEIGGKVGENFRDFIPHLPLSKELVTIRCDLDLEIPLAEARLSAPNNEALVELYQALQFNKWLSELGESPVAAARNPESVVFKPGEYEIVFSEDRLAYWVEQLQGSAGFAFDTETTSLSAQEAELVGVSFSCEMGKAAYIPVGHQYLGAPQQLPLTTVVAAIKPVLEDPTISKIGQNIKYDINVLRGVGIEVKGVMFDTMLASYVLDSVGSRHDMDSLSLKHLGHQPVAFTEVAGKGKAQLTFDQVDIDKGGHYAAEDADVTYRLYHCLLAQLVRQPSLHRVYTEIEMPLVPVLARIENTGVLIDDTLLLTQSQELAASMMQVEEKAYTLAGGQFNLASPKQIQEILYDQMALPVLRKTPKGAPSTAEDALQELAEEHELPRLILEHRSLGKLKSTYTDKLPLMINAKTARVHTSYHQAVAATGRLSSSDPNLQNIPIRTAEGRRIREAFIAQEGSVILAADYSQIELRIMAHLSSDSALISAFQQNLDIHRATASEIFDVALNDVSGDQRRYAKAVNFGLIYGMSAFGLARQLGVERREAQNYIDQYFARYPGVKAYMEQTRELARERGYVETVFGRRLYLPDIHSKNHNMRQYAERTAINAPMQGTAADIIKLAMVEVQQWLSSANVGAKMIMQVHDELVFEVEHDIVESVDSTVRELMQNVVDLKVPLLVEAAFADNWSKAH